MIASEAVCLAVCVEFVLDPSSGDPWLPTLVGAASALTLVLCLVKPSWEWVSGPRETADTATGPGARKPAKARGSAEAAGAAVASEPAGAVETRTV